MGRFLAFLLLLIAAPPALAQTFPALTGRVVDQANLLDPAQEQAITAKSEALERATGRQFVVATVNSLEGREIADYGYRLGRTWGIGTEAKNDGVILLIAPNERKMRIEVGYGLEPILTDALSSIIISRQIRPRFKQGDLAGGIIAGADAVIQQVSLPPAEAAARQQQLITAEQKSQSGGGIPVELIFWIIILVVFFVIPMLSRSRGRRYRDGGAPVIIWGGGDWGGGSGGSWGGGSDGGGFSGGGGSFGGGGASGDW